MSAVRIDASLSEDVRRHDYDRYLCTLFAPDDRRPRLVSLLAFNLELARVRERVNEPTLGRMRLEWWRETIEGVFQGSPRQHPIAQALAQMIEGGGLPPEPFKKMIDARAREYDEWGFDTFEALELYAQETAGQLNRLYLPVLGVSSPEADEAARHVGAAWALTGLARSVPYHARSGRVYLPRDALAEVGVSVDDILSQQAGFRLKPVIEAIVGRAVVHLEAARALRARIPASARPAMLPAVLTDAYARTLRRRGFDPFSLPSELNRPMRQLRLIWAALRKTY